MITIQLDMILSLSVNDQSDQVGGLSVQVTPFAIRVSAVSGDPAETLQLR
jgi:hypothetical protein